MVSFRMPVQNVRVQLYRRSSLNVFSTANVGALTATSVDASDATGDEREYGAIVVSGTDGGLGVA